MRTSARPRSEHGLPWSVNGHTDARMRLKEEEVFDVGRVLVLNNLPAISMYAKKSSKYAPNWAIICMPRLRSISNSITSPYRSEFSGAAISRYATM